MKIVFPGDTIRRPQLRLLNQFRLCNSDRALCEERIGREHLQATKDELTRLPLTLNEVKTLEKRVDNRQEALLDFVRKVISELVSRNGVEVLFAATYAELDQEEPMLRTHRHATIIDLLDFWKDKFTVHMNCVDFDGRVIPVRVCTSNRW